MQAAQAGRSIEKIVIGAAKAAPVRDAKKRKVTAQDAGRVPAPFADSVGAQQSLLEDSWGQSKVTPTRQATIDFYLLRFIVCCFVAFSIVDSGFFIDFVIALYVTSSLDLEGKFLLTEID